MSILNRITDAIFAPHCTECGARCTQLHTGYYDPQDGTPEWIYACPTRDMTHWGMNDCRLKMEGKQ